MTTARNRIHVMHGVNLDQIGRRDPQHYGGMTFLQLEQTIDGFAGEYNLEGRLREDDQLSQHLVNEIKDLAAGA